MDPKAPAPTSEVSSFPVPFTLEALRKDIANVFLHHLRTVAWMTDVATAESIVPGLAEDDVRFALQWEADAEDIGLTYQRLKHTTLVKTMEVLYRYAYFGELDSSSEPMGDESIYTWTTALVHDAAHGRLAVEWSDNGSFTDKAAARCLMVCELANARHTLEGGEPFYFKFGNYGKESATGSDCLTIRQMALLAGMEEMSIRAAANKTQKRANPLETYSADGGTRIALDVAKSWLQSKGRYVPIKLRLADAEIDLAKTQFANADELWHAVQLRYETLCARKGIPMLTRANGPVGLNIIGEFVFASVKDAEAAKEFAAMLEWPGDLFVLRCREVAAREALAEVEREIKQAVTSSTDKENA